MDKKPGTLYTLCYELGKERAKFLNKKSANNFQQIIQKTVRVHYSFCGFFYSYSQRITYEVPTCYRADTGKDSVKSSQNFLIFSICSGWTHPVSSSIVHSSYRYCDDFAKDLPAISRPRGGFFHNFDFETNLPLSKTIAGRNFPVLLRFVLSPSRYCVFCSGSTSIQSRSILSC